MSKDHWENQVRDDLQNIVWKKMTHKRGLMGGYKKMEKVFVIR
jgi:hypothetical protein